MIRTTLIATALILTASPTWTQEIYAVFGCHQVCNSDYWAKHGQPGCKQICELQDQYGLFNDIDACQQAAVKAKQVMVDYLETKRRQGYTMANPDWMQYACASRPDNSWQMK